MERFVFVTAIVFAVIYALVQMVGGGHSISFNIGDMEGGGSDPVIEVSAGQLAAQSFASGGIDIRHAAARIVVTPEDRTDISIEIDNPGRLPMPEIRAEDGDLVVDGQLRGRISECLQEAVDVRGYGVIANPELPLITIRAPRTLNLDIGSGSTLQVGPSQSLEAEFSGCGTAQIGDVAETLAIDFSGSGAVSTGAARALKADVAGSGELRTGAITERADVDLAGSGEIELASLTGALALDSAGSGSLAVRGGAVTDASIDLAGSGNVEIAAPVQNLQVAIVGSGDVNVAGAVGDIDADIAGSGGVNVQSVTGAVRKDVWGSGDVHVRGRTAPPAPPAPPPPT
jgi:hypothetical protein